MQIKSKYFVFAATLLTLVASCRKADEQAPLIDQVFVNVDAEFYFANAGADNSFEIKASDDRGLKQMKIAFSTVSGLHHHEEGSTHAFMEINQGSWDSLRIVNVSGNSANEVFNFQIPLTVSGGWEMQVAVLDETGNLTSEDMTLHINNAELPSISVASTTPAASDMGEITVSNGGILSLTGSVMDTDSLASVQVMLFSGSTEYFENTWLAINDWTFDLSQIILPAFTATGKYTLSISAIDMQGWSRTVQATVMVE